MTETKVIIAFQSLDALSPNDQAFHDRLAQATLGGWRATAMRKTVITLDDYLAACAEQNASRAAEQARLEAAQAQHAARLKAEEEARAELRLQAIDRAEELVTRLVAQDPYLRQTLTETDTDLALLFARLRNPEPEPEPDPSVLKQKEIDAAAEKILYAVFSDLMEAHPRSKLGFENVAYQAVELARADRGEPDPYDDDDDIFNDVPWEDDDLNGSADALVRSSYPAANHASVINEDAPLGPRTASSAIAPAHSGAPDQQDAVSEASPVQQDAVSGVRQPCCRFQSPTPLTAFKPALPASYSTSPSNPQSEPEALPLNSQSNIPHSIPTVPSCPTLSPRRLANMLSEAEADIHFPQTQPAEPAPESDSPITPAEPAEVPFQRQVTPLIEPPASPDLAPSPSHFSDHFASRGRSPTSF